MSARLEVVRQLALSDIKLFIPSVANRVTGKSMGQHAEETTQAWGIPRAEQDEIALASHQRAVAAQDAGFFDDLIVEVGGTKTDAFPRRDTSLEKLARLRPVFDRSDKGTLTAGNSSPLTDGAAGVWVASDAGLGRLRGDLPKAKLLDFELGAVDIHSEGLLMAPAYALPRLLARHGLSYDDIALFEIHEAFAAQVLFTVAAWEDAAFLRDKVGLDETVAAGLGSVPRERINPHGGSVSLGHPFGATGARILSQAVKELDAMPSGSKAIVSICADGGVGTVLLLERA
jgi:acetyl-CoA C-acetyltransferase